MTLGLAALRACPDLCVVVTGQPKGSVLRRVLDGDRTLPLTLALENRDATLFLDAACARAASSGDPLQQFTVEPDKGHFGAIDAFIDQVLGQGPEFCGVADAVSATRIAFAAIQSAHENRVVQLAEVA